MHKILRIDTSLNGDNALSTQLINHFIENLESSSVTLRDLSKADIPHLTGLQHAGFALPAEERNEQQQAAIQLSDELISELRAADTIILGVPLYNFGIPSSLKVWIDYIARAGETFNYTSDGPKGTLTNKKVLVIATRGGIYAGTPNDTQAPFLKQVLGFLGLDNLEFIYAEGLAMSNHTEASINETKAQLASLAGEFEARAA